MITKKKKINKLEIKNENQQSIIVWGIIAQKKMHVLAKEIAEILKISLELIENQEFHIFGHQQTETFFFLIKNHKKDIFSELCIDYFFIVKKNDLFKNFDTLLFKPLKNKKIIQGAYFITLPSKVNKKIVELLQTI